MQVKNYSDFRKNLANTMNMVTDNRMPVVITRAKKEPVVMISLADFNSYEETAYLLGTKKNRERLLSSIKNVKKGNYKEQKLIEIEDEED